MKCLLKSLLIACVSAKAPAVVPKVDTAPLNPAFKEINKGDLG